ncbi:MAG: hypothetical protein ACLQKA_05285 [Bryobacteraceae bacterium]
MLGYVFTSSAGPTLAARRLVVCEAARSGRWAVEVAEEAMLRIG